VTARRRSSAWLDAAELRQTRRVYEQSGFDPTGDRPDPSRPAGTDRMPQIAHIVVLMMENHSYDAYLGAMVGRGDGLPTDHALTNPDNQGRPVPTHHLDGTWQPQEIPCQSWLASHMQWNGGACDGFVRSAQTVAARARPPLDQTAVSRIMGHWDEDDLPFYWGLARTFPVADRWFGSCLGPTFPNRRFLLAGTAYGLSDDDPAKCFDYPPSGTVFDLFTQHGISWMNFHSTAALRLILSRLVGRPGRQVAGRLAPRSRDG
jgi:phospholipase C